MSTENDASYYIEKLGLIRHPEGGWYKESYRSETRLTPSWSSQPDSHHVSTAIYFLLQAPGFSAFHRIRSDEMWHIYDCSPGAGLRIWILDEKAAGDVKLSTVELGRDLTLKGRFQAWIPAGLWFAAEVFNQQANPGYPEPWVLSGCTVAPGFEFLDFELAKADYLAGILPDQRDLVKRLCIA